jgi:protein ImuB
MMLPASDGRINPCMVGISARAAFADTRSAAHALARFAARPALIVPERESAERIKPLPIAALRIPADTVDDLRKLKTCSLRPALR